MGTLGGKGLIKEKINRGLSWKAAKSHFCSTTGDSLPIYIEIATEESNFIIFGRSLTLYRPGNLSDFNLMLENFTKL